MFGRPLEGRRLGGRALGGRGLGSAGRSSGGGALGDGELARLPLNSTIGWLGHSRFAARNTRGIPHQTMALTGGRYYHNPYCVQARDGATTTQFLAILPTLLAINPAVVVIAPPVNDLGAVSYASVIQPNYESMITACRAAGARIVIQNEPASTNYSAGGNTDRGTYNTWLQSIVAPDLKIADWTAMDMANAALSYDTVHFTELGAFTGVSGPAADAAILNAWIDNTTDVMASVDTNVDTMFGAQMNVETDMGGSIAATAPATGTLYTGGGNAASNTGVTVVMQASDDGAGLLHGEKAQKMTVSGTSNSTVNDTRFHRAQSFAFVAGDYLETFSWVRITAADDVSPPANLAGFHVKSGNFGQIFDETITANNGKWGHVFDGLLRTNPAVFTIQASSITPELSTRYTNLDVVDAKFLQSGLRWRLTERRAYGVPRDQSIPGDGGAAIYVAASATPASGVAGTAFSSTPGNVSGGGWYSTSPVPGLITYQWKKASDNTNVGVGTGETTRSWTSTGAPAGDYYCAITWTNANGTITVNSNNITVT